MGSIMETNTNIAISAEPGVEIEHFAERVRVNQMKLVLSRVVAAFELALTLTPALFGQRALPQRTPSTARNHSPSARPTEGSQQA